MQSWHGTGFAWISIHLILFRYIFNFTWSIQFYLILILLRELENNGDNKDIKWD